MVMRSTREKGPHRGIHKENISPQLLLGKLERSNLVNSCNKWAIKPAVYSLAGLAGIEA